MHILDITVDRCPNCPPGEPCLECAAEPDITYAIQCPCVTQDCRWWINCQTAHDPANDLTENPVDHGEEHQRIDGCWMVATEWCMAQECDNLDDAGTETGLPVGSHPVCVSWESESLLIEPLIPSGPDVDR